MKFTIYGKHFADIVNRIGGIIPKKNTFPIIQNIKITASKKTNTLTLQATNLIGYCTINSYANVYEDGIIFVRYDDIKKAIGISDEITVTFSDKVLDIRSAKKSYEIPCMSEDSCTDYPKFLDTSTEICTQNEKELLGYLENLGCILDIYSPNTLLQTFYFDFPKQKIIAMNEHMIGIASVSNRFPNANPILVHGSSCVDMKKLAGKSSVEKVITIYADNKVVKFQGDDWTYSTNLVQGKYYNYDGFMRHCGDYAFKCDGKELLKIAKEYQKCIPSNKRTPMYFVGVNGKIATGITTDNYRTSDVLDVMPEYGLEKEWFKGFNPSFIVDACKICDGDIMVCSDYKKNVPFFIEDNTYKICVLPVNITNEPDFIMRQIV